MTAGSRRSCYVAGHRGLLGSAIVRALDHAGYAEPIVRTRDELDLRDQAKVRSFFADTRPQIVFMAAAKVGGIHANNTQRWDFLHHNLLIEANILGAAVETGVERLVFLEARAFIRASHLSLFAKTTCSQVRSS